ncbi:MAG: 3-dehydro-L-gulonate 2-dehydrogenase, partial [Rikenellaceae bacterium]|nr:3-dehydro-L-gulonate 2-dehydrogenase [Rikenellaceae bacterium]
MRLKYDELVIEFDRVLRKKGVGEETAALAARLFASNSLDGVASHGANRFPKIVELLEHGFIQPNTAPESIASFGAFEQWDGNLGLGNVTATRMMDRAIALARAYGIGCVAVRNTNHWLRGGTYGWQAAEAGCVGICWTNAIVSMAAWGAREARLGNNPLVMAVPRKEGHVVVDTAMSQFSYGRMEQYRLRDEQLPYAGGYDEQGRLTTDPATVERTWCALPIGYWKGSGLSMLLDLMAAAL